MIKMKNTFVLILAGSFLLSCTEREGNTEKAEYETENDSLINLVERQQKTLDSLEQLPPEEMEDGYPILWGRAFRDIDNPEAFITEDLSKRPELIPLDAVLGGTMAFRKVEVLSDKWVMAIYDDGHIQGQAIFQYRLLPDKSVAYEVIAVDHPEQ